MSVPWNLSCCKFHSNRWSNCLVFLLYKTVLVWAHIKYRKLSGHTWLLFCHFSGKEYVGIVRLHNAIEGGTQLSRVSLQIIVGRTSFGNLSLWAPRHLGTGLLFCLASLTPFLVGYPSLPGQVTADDRGSSGHIASEERVLISTEPSLVEERAKIEKAFEILNDSKKPFVFQFYS